MKDRMKVLSIRPSDCVMDVFRAGGSGGQAQNKTNSGVRFRHLPSGAVGESREHRSQLQNKRAAWRRMAESVEMQTWIRRRVAEEALSRSQREEQERRIADKVERSVRDENLVVDVGGEGNWTRVPSDSGLASAVDVGQGCSPAHICEQ